MGRSGIRRRKAPRHLPKLGGQNNPRGFTPEHSPWTVEGRIEAFGMMGRGLKNASPAQSRYLGRMVKITAAALVIIALAAWLVHAL